MSCYFQILAIFYHLKNIIENVKGVEVAFSKCETNVEYETNFTSLGGDRFCVAVHS